jgi:septal ring factor EnvC (AmiA/AmiB activator)
VRKNLKYRRYIAIPVFLGISMLVISEGVNGQSKNELQERKEKTEKEIEYTNKLLEQTRLNRRNTIQRVRILEKRIQLRNQIILDINEETKMIEREIEDKQDLIHGMQKDLETLREQYAQAIVNAYWNQQRRNWMMFVLSSESFNQAYRRMKYLQQFSKHRRQQAEMIRMMQDNIRGEVMALEKIRLDKERLMADKIKENQELENEKGRKNQMVSNLSRRERELRNEIERKRNIADELEKEIAKIIAEEAKKSRSRNMYDQLTPQEKLISDNFQGNKGKLPWPVERGVITGEYGVHPHPVLKQVTIDNDGIDISTVKGAEARAMFDGEVTKIVSILGANYTVIIRHGNFLSVYQNIVNLRVKQGDKVTTQQVLGIVYTDEQTNSTVLHVQIWKETKSQDPGEWISRN